VGKTGDGKRKGKDNDIAVPELVIGDLFEDAFRPIAHCRKYRSDDPSSKSI
jgi:hypothetical protein